MTFLYLLLVQNLLGADKPGRARAECVEVMLDLAEDCRGATIHVTLAVWPQMLMEVEVG